MAQIARLHAELQSFSHTLAALEHAIDCCEEGSFGESTPQIDYARINRIRAKLGQGNLATSPRKNRLQIQAPPTPAAKHETKVPTDPRRKRVNANQVAPNPPLTSKSVDTSQPKPKIQSDKEGAPESAKGRAVQQLRENFPATKEWRSTSGLVESALSSGPSLQTRTRKIHELLSPEQLRNFDRQGFDFRRILELQVLFVLFDTDGDDMIDRSELALAAKHLKHLKIYNPQKLSARMTSNKDGEVNFFEFIQLIQWMEAEERSFWNRFMQIFGQALHPETKFCFYWNLCTAACVLHSAWLIPVRIGFRSEPDILTYIVDIMTEIWFLLDLCWFNMKQGYQDSTALVLVMDLSKIRRRYFRTWFMPDLVSSIPVELIALVFVGGDRSALADFAILRVVRFVKIFRLVKLLNLRAFRTLEKRQPVLARAIKLLFSFFFVIHYMACCYWLVVRTNCGKVKDLVEHPFCPTMPGLLHLSSGWEDLSRKYTFAAYWSLLTMLGGNSMEQDTTKETFFTFCMLLIGMLSFTSIIGSASALIGSLDSHDSTRKSELAFVRQDLTYLGVGPETQELVEQYLVYTWAIGQTPAHTNIRARLPLHIQEEINFHRLRALVHSTQFFGALTPRTVLRLAHVFQSKIVAVGDYAYRQSQSQHDVSLGLRFVYTGQIRLEWVNAHGHATTVSTLRQGAMFGAAAMMVGGCYLVDAIAEQCTETLFVSVEHFVELMLVKKKGYLETPDVMSLVGGKGRRRLPQDSKLRTANRGEPSDEKSRVKQKAGSKSGLSPLSHLYDEDGRIQAESTGHGMAGNGASAGDLDDYDGIDGTDGTDGTKQDTIEASLKSNYDDGCFNSAVAQEVRSFAVELGHTVQVYGRARRHSLLDQVVKTWRTEVPSPRTPGSLTQRTLSIRRTKVASFNDQLQRSREPSREPSPVMGESVGAAPDAHVGRDRRSGAGEGVMEEPNQPDSRGSAGSDTSSQGSGRDQFDGNERMITAVVDVVSSTLIYTLFTGKQTDTQHQSTEHSPLHP
jgi:hyperpolarization activated cyclic nucleotide-gated potassium channel 2